MDRERKQSIDVPGFFADVPNRVLIQESRIDCNEHLGQNSTSRSICGILVWLHSFDPLDKGDTHDRLRFPLTFDHTPRLFADGFPVAAVKPGL